MVNRTQVALRDAAEWLGDWHPLAEQLGSADRLLTTTPLASILGLRPVVDLSSLRRFLEEYHARLLLPLELPAVLSAYHYASFNGLRELVALDQQLAGESGLRDFAEASRRVGQAQLRKLRPLRDARLVQRYLRAVESGQANGWHTLVYGMTLSVYSLPLRQGLLGYSHQTTRGFIYAAARPLRLSERTCRAVFDDLSASLATAVAGLITQPPAVAQGWVL